MASNILAKMAVLISAQTAEFNKALAQSQNQLTSFGKTSQVISKTLAAFGVGFGIYELANGIKASIGIMADFEKTMSEVKAITGATGDEFAKLEKDAKDLGASTKYTASQVGQLQIAYGRLGFTTKEILAATAATLDLAAATGEDLAKSADVAGSTVRGFGLEARETQRVVDVMASSFNKTALGLDNFTESMKYVAPVANAAGASVEETTAMLGVLADAGIRGSMAGTSLRKIFTDMTKDGRPLSERLAELAKKGITLQDSFDEVGRTAQTSLLILSKNTAKTGELAAAFQTASGEAAKMAHIMSDNLTGDVTRLTSAWEGLVLSLSNSSILRSITQDLTGLLGALSGNVASKMNSELEGVAKAIKGGLTDDLLGGFIKNLSDLRKEMGKPIALNNVEFLSEKYKLSSDQANILYRAILKANEALSFQEEHIKKFNDFAARHGYKDLNVALEDYKRGIYKLIVAQEIQKQQYEEVNQKGTFDPELKDIGRKIDGYRRIIRLLNEYAEGFPKIKQEEAKTTPVIIKNLEYYKEQLKKVNEEYERQAVLSKDGTDAVDSRLRILSQEIVSLETIIKRLETIRNLRNTDMSLSVDTKALETFDLKKPLDRALASMQAFRAQYAAFMKSFKKETEDIGPMIANGIVGIAEAFGEAAAGTGNFGEAILKAMAGFAQQLGAMMIATGVAEVAFKSFSGPAMIAAGIALVAAATAAKAIISNRPNLKTAAVSSGGSATRNSSSYSPMGNGGQDSNGRVEFVIRRGDLWGVLNQFEKDNRFTKISNG